MMFFSNHLVMAFTWRKVLMVALLVVSLSAKAEVGDRWEAEGVVTENDEVLSCMFEVVSEDPYEVRFAARGAKTSTISGKSPRKLTFYDEVEHDGHTYRVVEIGDYAFYNIESLNRVLHLSSDVRRIGKHAFDMCTTLLSFSFSDKVTEIDDYAFNACEYLTNTNVDGANQDAVYLPSSLKTIGECAFRVCRDAQFRFNEGLEHIGMYAFQDCHALTQVTLPASVREMGPAPFVWCKNLKNIYVDKENPCFYDIDGVLYGDREGESGTETCLVEFPYARTGRYDIADGTNVILFDAFYGVRLSEVFVPFTVGEIEEEAFCSCKNLRGFYVEWTSNVPLVHEGAFDNLTAQNVLLYVPSEATGMTAEGILDFYLEKGFNRYFAGVESYTPDYFPGLRIGGNSFRRTNAMSITKGVTSGTVSYDIANRTLVLSDATIVGSLDEEYGIENNAIDGLTIELYGENTINTSAAGMWLADENTIKGPGSLTIVSDQAEGIKLSRAMLTIEDATLDIDSRGGALSGGDEAYVYVVHSKLILRPTGASGVATVNKLTSLLLDRSHIASPLFAHFDSSRGIVADRNGEAYYGYISIMPGNAYDLYVGTMVTEENKDDVNCNELASGHVSYDPERNVVTLDNVDISDNASILCNNIHGLTVKLVGTNKLLSTEETVRLFNDMTFVGNGSLRIKSEAGVAILIENDYTTLTFKNTTMNIFGYVGAISGKQDGEEQRVEVRNANVVMNAEWGEPVVCRVDGFDLYNCYFDNHDQYYDDSYRGICNYDDNGEIERYETIEIVATGSSTAVPSVDATLDNYHASTLYNLQGQRVGDDYRGIVIKNGKKQLKTK